MNGLPMLRDETATRYGPKYIVDGWLVTPVGRVGIRTVWIVPEGSLSPEVSARVLELAEQAFRKGVTLDVRHYAGAA